MIVALSGSNAVARESIRLVDSSQARPTTQCVLLEAGAVQVLQDADTTTMLIE